MYGFYRFYVDIARFIIKKDVNNDFFVIKSVFMAFFFRVFQKTELRDNRTPAAFFALNG